MKKAKTIAEEVGTIGNRVVQGDAIYRDISKVLAQVGELVDAVLARKPGAYRIAEEVDDVLRKFVRNHKQVVVRREQ